MVMSDGKLVYETPALVGRYFRHRRPYGGASLMAEIKAEPFAFPLKRDAIALIVIDMQRDFAEPGGFGASLGNDVGRITRIVPDVKRLIEGFRDAGLPVIHTMECHRPDLSDLPPAKRNRGNPTSEDRRRGTDGPRADRRRTGHRDPCRSLRRSMAKSSSRSPARAPSTPRRSATS